MKHYRDFTVGELLDMGFDIDVFNHNCSSKEEANRVLSMFEGIERRHDASIEGANLVRGWKEEFEVVNVIKLKEE